MSPPAPAPPAPRLLIVDDEPGVRQVLASVAEQVGFDVCACGSGAAALETSRRNGPHVALVDLRLPDVPGLDLIEMLAQVAPDCRILAITGHATIESAVASLQRGARDYLAKPIDLARLRDTLCALHRDAIAGADASRGRAPHPTSYADLIAESPAMRELMDVVRRLAPQLTSALIVGELGTGKEALARALHAAGPLCGEPFIRLDCGALDATLSRGIDGSWHPATPGTLRLPDAGAVYLDEIADLSPASQRALVRALEAASRDGCAPGRPSLQMLAATARDPRAALDQGRLRSDLYYLLSVIELHVPPLRERREDIEPLALRFIDQWAGGTGGRVRGMTADAAARLRAASWEGNLRELRAAVERACLLAEGPLITDADLTHGVTTRAQRAADGGSRRRKSDVPQPLAGVERNHVRWALERAAGNKKEAARLLGVSRRALYRRLERLQLGDRIRRRSDTGRAGEDRPIGVRPAPRSIGDE